jgi:hypothetical protein
MNLYRRIHLVYFYRYILSMLTWIALDSKNSLSELCGFVPVFFRHQCPFYLQIEHAFSSLSNVLCVQLFYWIWDPFPYVSNPALCYLFVLVCAWVCVHACVCNCSFEEMQHWNVMGFFPNGIWFRCVDAQVLRKYWTAWSFAQSMWIVSAAL